MGQKKGHFKDSKAPAPKEPRSKLPTENIRPVWSFSKLDVGGPWCFSNTEAGQAAPILQKLGQFEGMTWGELATQKSHAVPVSGICKAARDRLAELKQDDIDELFSFRLSAAVRIWGIRDANVIRVLWWDPEHVVWTYDVQTKSEGKK